mmetsp:Transcript_49809/g.131076  ORF Transcript_49809/g.131076 Transcript_49809/m.131076 type:complete len:487 (+) Transcript_49809:75-1535(+)
MLALSTVGTSSKSSMMDADVYISCAWKDREKVRQIKADLEEAGFVTSWDTDRLSNSGPAKAANEVMLTETAQAIDICQVFICCISPDYMESKLAQKEVKLASYWGKCIIPVKVARQQSTEQWIPKGDISAAISKLYCIDLSDSQSYQTKIRELFGRLEKISKSLASGRGGLGLGEDRRIKVEDMQPDDVCQLLAKLFIPQDKIESFMRNGVSGKDLLDFTDEDLKGEDLQLTGIQVKKLRKEIEKLQTPPAPRVPLSSVMPLGGVGADGRPLSSTDQAAAESSMAILARNKEKGDPTQIIAALRGCVNDARVQVEGMQVIRNLVWGKAEEQNAVCAAGGIEAIIAGMQQHRGNVDVQEMGCSALGNLAWSNAPIQQRIAELGGVEEIVRAMQAHLRSGGCMQKCTLALGNLGCHPTNQVKIAQLNGIQLILDALQEHPQHQLCIQYCCWAMKNLCLNPDNKGQIIRANGHRLVVQVAPPPRLAAQK